MTVREGMVPTILGAAVTTAGLTIRAANPVLGWGIAGFGLAHVLLGAIDLVEHNTPRFQEEF
ncbi:asparagine synthase [Desulforamulus ruminis]|uniref:asparagine synthase n=1 Tax=Desulforamulus ruminis TaxID=1564 RepID=UPI0023572151|nr:asparagine synthase [Desulforamulus ruminis]